MAPKASFLKAQQKRIEDTTKSSLYEASYTVAEMWKGDLSIRMNVLAGWEACDDLQGFSMHPPKQ